MVQRLEMLLGAADLDLLRVALGGLVNGSGECVSKAVTTNVVEEFHYLSPLLGQVLDEAHLEEGGEAHAVELGGFLRGVAHVLRDAHGDGDVLAVNEEGQHLAARGVPVK